jgi:hypothetical protein
VTGAEKPTGPAHPAEPEHLTGTQHSERAEKLIAQARQADPDRSAQLIAEAQVHATLALAAGHDDQPRSGWYGWLVLLVAGCFAGLAIFAYDGLSHWYRPVTLTATTTNLGALQHLTMSGTNASEVDWASQGFVQQLTITGPAQGTTEVTLPVPASKCPEMATKLGLGVACLPGQPLNISSNVTIGWSKADSVSINPDVVPGDLDILPSLARPSALGITIAPLANNSASAPSNSTPSICFEKPGVTSGATLTVADGTGKYEYSGPAWQTVCAGGLSSFGISIVVDWPVLEFGGINTFGLCASAPIGTVQGLTGQVNLNPAPTTVLNNPTTVSLQARSPEPLVALLDIGTAPQSCLPSQAFPPSCGSTQPSSSLVVCTQAATGVLTNSGQLVPSEWTRDSAFIVPLFGGIVAAVVVAPLGVSVQAFMEALKRLRWRAFTGAVNRLLRRPGQENEHAT